MRISTKALRIFELLSCTAVALSSSVPCSNGANYPFTAGDDDMLRMYIEDYQTNCVEASSTTCASALEYGYPINCWQVQAITNFRQLFSGSGLSNFNEDISAWDVSSVTNFDGTFSQAAQFNQPIGAWNVSSGVSFENMFHNTHFNQPLNDWDVSQATSLQSMFYAANAFNQPLDKWDVSKVQDFSAMFMKAQQFNQPLHEWDVSSGTTFFNMFGLEWGQSATAPTSFNQNLCSWGQHYDGTKHYDGTVTYTDMFLNTGCPSKLAPTSGKDNWCVTDCDSPEFGPVTSSPTLLPTSSLTLNPTGSPTKAPSHGPTMTPTVTPTNTPTNAPAQNVPYTFAHSPPIYNGNYYETNMQVPCPSDDSWGWIGPDRQGTQYAGGGEPAFYFVLDLGSSIEIDRLRVRNRNWDHYYCIKDYEVSVSDSQDSGYSAPISGTLINSKAFTQDIAIGLSGRYVKFQAVTYCIYSAGLYYVEVLMDGQSGSAHCPNDAPPPSPPTKSPSLTPTTSPTSSPITHSPTSRPTGGPVTSSPTLSPTSSSTLNPTGSPSKSSSATIPMDLIFDQVITNFGVKTPSNFTPGDGDIGVPSYDDMISTFTIGKGLDVHMFLFQKDCSTDVSKSLYTRTDTRADVNETHETLTVDYNFMMNEISSSSIWNETLSTIEVCQTAKLMVDGGAEYGDLVIKEDTRIVEIEFDLTTEFNITSELTGATIDTLDEYAGVDGAIYACKCGGLENYTCNTDELTPNEALYVCISTVEPTFEIENLESMTIIQGQTQMDIVKSGAVRPALANGIADRRQKSDDTGVAVTTLIPINLFDFQAGASVSVIGQINMKLASKRSDLFGRSLRANPARLEYEVSVDLKESDPEVPNSAQLDSDALNGVSDFDSFGSDFHALNEMSDFDSASVLSGSVLAILAFGIGAALM